MTEAKHVGVIDIGKTNAKVAVVDLEKRIEIGVLKLGNSVLEGPPYPHFDIEGLWVFICAALAELHEQHGIHALSVTAHGASIVVLDAAGELAAPVLDYEHTGPDSMAKEYDAIRPDFAETGSPRLAMGLNVGAQLFWQLSTDPGLSDRIATVVTYPQYWTYRLTGTLVNEVTSLGCHTDLWNPLQNRFSALVDRLGLQAKMPPAGRAVDCAGPILPEVAKKTGLPSSVKVTCGIHDSNASLLPHLLEREAPFSVVSTGTWVISLAIGGSETALDPKRDTLMNVNAFGEPVPSARFMGGREFDVAIAGRPASASDDDIETVLQRQIMLLPAIDPRSGPFQDRQARWSEDASRLADGELFATVSFYLALVTAECLALIGAAGPTIVEGPFAQNPQYLAMLEASTGRPVDISNASATGTSIGAALLVSCDRNSQRSKRFATTRKSDADPKFQAYAAAWRKRVQMP